MDDRDQKRKSSGRATQRVVVSVGKPRDFSVPSASAREIIQDARDEAYRIKKSAEEEAAKIRQESLALEKRIAEKEDNLDMRITQVQKQQQALDRTKEVFEKKEEETKKTREDLVKKLERSSSLTREEAKKLILENVEKELSDEIAKKIKEAEEKIQAEAAEKSKEILVNAMIAGATDWVAEYTVSTVKLESDDLKGRIIGREGRNIRAFELATGVDVELDSDMSDAGRKAAFEVGVYNLPQVATDALGRLKFRYSYGQNQLAAAIETSKIAKKIAQEVGADANICATGGLFHDIGKTEVEKEGTQVQLGVELTKKWNFPKEIVDCIAQHHEDEPFSSVESVVVHLADAVSGARPGARHESVEEYIKRLSEIEDKASTFDGVAKVYAIQAGREIRVIVNPEVLEDAQIVTLDHNISQKLEKELNYPGQITVTVIRETRAVDIAK